MKALTGVVYRNIKALGRWRARDDERRTFADRLADAVTNLAGNLWWVLAHAVVFGGWFLVNLGDVPRVRPFDPYPFALLATITYVEAIFLSSFILISQNRAKKLGDKRAELNVQVSLLTEHELTQAIHLLDAIGKKLGVEYAHEKTLDEIKRELSPEQIVDEIDRAGEVAS